ncbi:hypothetical protein Tco_1497648, partial [Tanacetum coccineum]
MMTSKSSSYYTGLGSRSFANPKYLEKAHLEKPYLYTVKYDKNDLTNLFAPKSEETIHLTEGSRSNLCHKAYVQSLKKEVDELESEKDEFSNEYDLLLQECLAKDIMCDILGSFDDINEQTEMQCLYLEKCEECENLELELSKSKTQQTDKHFANLEQHCIDLELALQHEKERNVCEKSWVKQSLKSDDTEKYLRAQNDSPIAELNRKTLEISDLKAQL